MNTQSKLSRSGLLFVAIFAFCACDSQREPGAEGQSERVRQTTQALTPEEQRTLQLEEVTDWEVASGAAILASSTNASQGLHSLAVSGMGYVGLRNSTMISQDEHEAPEVVGYDVWVPAMQVNPYWAGDTQLHIHAPSAGIYQQYLGYRSFQNVSKGEFTRVEYPLPAWIRQALDNSPYTDLQFTIAINVAPGSAPHYVDNFILGPQVMGPCEPVDDGNLCTADECDQSTGQTTHVPLAPGAICSDGNTCNGTETCDGSGICDPGTPLVVDDGNPCTLDSCDPIAGLSNSPVSAGFSCSDENACNGAEVCDGAGACASGTALAVDDGNPCTADACSPTGGVTHEPLGAGVACGDENACNGDEVCDGEGACLVGTSPELDDDNICTIDSCDPTTGVSHTPATAGTNCDDGNVCNGVSICDGASNCVAGATPVVDDGLVCTIDACDPTIGVTHEPSVVGSSCADANLCNGDEVCDGAGDCAAGVPLEVDDDNVCTSDACDPLVGVVHSAVDSGVTCSDGDMCNGAETCDGGGSCAAGAPIDVDDGNACTLDLCDAISGVSHDPAAPGTPCSDGDQCNGDETCDEMAICQSNGPPQLDDGNPCTEDACDPQGGVTHQAVEVGTSCSDGNACNGDEVCGAFAVCESGAPAAVDDGDPCTFDSCAANQGVRHTQVPAGTSCVDGDVCNGTETCDSAGACLVGTPLSTADHSNPCVIASSCDPLSGVTLSFESAGTACRAGFICNGAGDCLRDRGDGTLPLPVAPGATHGINIYGPTLPRVSVGDCELEELEPNHVSIITGHIFTLDLLSDELVPKENARVSVPRSCGTGAVWSQQDGSFRLPVNGGGHHMLRIEADADGDGIFDYLPVERRIEVGWRASVSIEEVVLLLPAPIAGTLELLNGTVQDDVVITAPTSQDDRNGDGIPEVRTPSLLFRAGTTVTATDENGVALDLDFADVRVTEYTVGPHGPQQMPAPMPPGTAYGYAMELSIDGAADVRFDRPVAYYLDSFIPPENKEEGNNYRVGTTIPAWYYNRTSGAWELEGEGVILRLLGIDGSTPAQVTIDADDDGDADADDESYLLSLNIEIDTSERQQLGAEVLAGARALGDELWRFEIMHFSPHDLNRWQPCSGDGCAVGNLDRLASTDGLDGPMSCKQGSMINVESMTVAERIKVAGTPYDLNYSSRAVYGYKPRRVHQGNISFNPLPDPLVIHQVVQSLGFAGTNTTWGCFPGGPNARFCRSDPGYTRTAAGTIWDGRNADGQLAYGTHRGNWSVATEVRLYWSTPRSLMRAFASRSFVKQFPMKMTVYDAKILGLGGWTLSPHHFFDVEGGILFRGDGTERANKGDIIRSLRDLSFSGDPIRGNLHVLADGTDRISNTAGVHEVTTTGSLVKWANASPNYALSMVPDGSNVLYTANQNPQSPDALRRLEKIDGVVQVTAQTTLPNRSGAIALGADNLLYVLVQEDPLAVYRYTRNLELVDDEEPLFAFTAFPGANSQASNSVMAFDGDVLYLAVGNARGIYKYAPGDEVPEKIGSGGAWRFDDSGFVEGMPALSVPTDVNTYFNSLVPTPEGIMFSVRHNYSIWMIDNDGLMRKIAGEGTAPAGSGNGGPALSAGLGWDFAFDVAPDQSIKIYQRFPQHHLREIRPPGPEGFLNPTLSVPNETGTMVYDFDSDGHHLRTRSVATNDVIYSFEYEDGLLSAIIRGDGEGPNAASLPRTTIDRSVGGQVTIQSPAGQQTTIAINPSTGYATSIVDPAGGATHLAHDADGLLHEMVDTRGLVHSYGYDELGQLTSDTSPGLEPQTLSGRQMSTITHTNGENEHSTYTLDVDQSTQEVTRTIVNPDGSSMIQEVDSRLNRARRMSDGTTIEEHFIKHPTFGLEAPIWQTRSTTLPSGLSSSEQHELKFVNNVWTETFVLNGNSSSKVTRPAQRTTTTTTAGGRTVVTTLDEQSRPIVVQVGDLLPTIFNYDAQGRVIETLTGPRSAAFSYFPDGTGFPEAGHLQTVTDAENQIVTFTRDAFGRALSSRVSSDTIEFDYSATGSMDQLTTAEGDSHFQNYNGVDLLTEYLAPALSGTDNLTEFAYDNARRIASATHAGSIGVTYTREGANPEFPELQGRLREVNSPNSGNGTAPFQVALTYADEIFCTDPGDDTTCSSAGAPGQLKTLSRGDLNTTFTFDGSLMVAETHAVNGSATGLIDTGYSRVLTNGFKTASGRVTVGAMSSVASMSYDADELLVCAGYGDICSQNNGIEFDFDAGPRDAAPSGHGLLEASASGVTRESYTYNSFGEVASRELVVDGAVLLTSTYDDQGAARDLLGRLVTESEVRAGAASSVEYGYDSKGQLIRVTRDGGIVRNYKYDSNGNRLCAFDSPAIDCDDEASFDAQDRLRSQDGFEYLYTDRGSLFQRTDGVHQETFTYDALGNLTQVAEDGGDTIDYMIGPQNRRVGKKVNGALQYQYVWSSKLRIAAELDATGQIVSRFIYGNQINVPALIVKPGAAGDKIYRVVTDHLGSPLIVVNIDDATDILLDAHYDEWGKVTEYASNSGSWPLPFGYAGGLYDEDTGLVRFGARDYDPSIGRWTSKDPILFAGGQANLYVYVGNDPVNFVDPRGLYSLSEFGSDVLDVGAQAVRGVWTSPQLAAGLVVGTVGSFGNASVVGGNLEFYNNWAVGAFGTAGLTLGNIIIYSGQNPSAGLRAHEQQHVPQSDLLGPFYLPAHILNQAIGEGVMGMPHGATPLECGPSDASNRRPWK